MAREPNTLYQEMTPPLYIEEMGPPTKKELISVAIHVITSPPYN
jgi:hypothetical protein